MGDSSAFDPVVGVEERFTLRSRPEILAVLRSLEKQRAMITVYFDRGREFILTTILAINPDFQEIVMDLGSDERVNALMLKSTRLLVVGYEDKIKIQFGTSLAEATTHNGHPAFRVRVPGSLVRLQRRDFYRIQLPLGKPVKAYLQPFVDNPDRLIEARVVDISCGGVALTMSSVSIPIANGSLFPACSINLPGIGTVSAPVQITYVSDVTLKNGARERRAGCRFVRLPGAMQSLIQRYINQAEREQHALRA